MKFSFLLIAIALQIYQTLFAQNVGINVTNPIYPLTISSSNPVGGVIALDNNANILAKNSLGFYESVFIPRTNTDATFLNFGTNGLFLRYANNNLITVLNNGNLGIGTINPTDKLMVQTGTNSYGITHTNGTVTLGTYTGDTGGWLGTKTNHPLFFFTNNGSAQMTISSSGNVGIGVGAAVNAKLRIISNQQFGLFVDGSATAGGAMLLIQGTSETNVVSIGGTATNGYNLKVNGSAAKTDGLAFWTLPSDARLKEQIVPYSAGLADLLKINPVKYHYTKASGLNNDKENIGILAQNLKEIAPYMVGKKKGVNTEEEFYDVNLSPMLFMYVNAFKEVDAKIKSQEEEIKKLQDLVKQLVDGKK